MAQNVKNPDALSVVLTRAEEQFCRAYNGFLLGRRTRPYGTNEGLSNADGQEDRRKMLESWCQDFIGVHP